MVWAHIEHNAQGVVRRALGKLADGIEDPDTINWDRAAELTNQSGRQTDTQCGGSPTPGDIFRR